MVAAANKEFTADYYPYGKVLREWNPQAEKYLTTHHERDAETGLDYRGARYYDADVARFLSLDPKAMDYPSLSDYCYVAANPLIFKDSDGRDITIAGDEQFVANTKNYLAQIAATDVGYKAIQALLNSDKMYTFNESIMLITSDYNEDNNTVHYDDNPWKSTLDGGAIDGKLALGHELYHAFQDETNQVKELKNGDVGNVPYLERGAVRFTNYLRNSFGQSPLRLQYSGIGAASTFLTGSNGPNSLPTEGKVDVNSVNTNENGKVSVKYSVTSSKVENGKVSTETKQNERTLEGIIEKVD